MEGVGLAMEVRVQAAIFESSLQQTFVHVYLLFGQFWKHSLFEVKIVVTTLWATFSIFGLLFIPSSSGHTGMARASTWVQVTRVKCYQKFSSKPTEDIIEEVYKQVYKIHLHLITIARLWLLKGPIAMTLSN